MKKSIILIACFLFISLKINYAQDSCIQNNRNKLDSICRVVFQQWNLPGMAVVVIQDGKEVLLKGYGKTSYEGNGQKVTPQTQFVIASTSKAMTSALLATLVQKGDVKWGDT
ncbi:MAG: serine hydrolase, partial [Bacteroidales bacterium]|nr:serine hydrolase [Bacteroidales bacterium]